MSVYEHPLNIARRDAAPRRPRVTVAQLFLRAVQRWRRSRAIASLERLSDRQLEDVGIARNDIPRIVQGIFVESDASLRSSASPAARHRADPRRRAA